jgi:hypothetical protein
VHDLGEGVWRGGVVVLEHGAHLGDAPAAGAEAGAAGVGVGEAVDAAPGVLGLVVGLAVGWASSQRLRAATTKLLPWFWRAISDPKSHLRVVNLPPGTLVATQKACSSRWVHSVSVSLREEG